MQLVWSQPLGDEHVLSWWHKQYCRRCECRTSLCWPNIACVNIQLCSGDGIFVIKYSDIWWLRWTPLSLLRWYQQIAETEEKVRWRSLAMWSRRRTNALSATVRMYPARMPLFRLTVQVRLPFFSPRHLVIFPGLFLQNKIHYFEWICSCVGKHVGPQTYFCYRKFRRIHGAFEFYDSNKLELDNWTEFCVQFLSLVQSSVDANINNTRITTTHPAAPGPALATMARMKSYGCD